MDVIENFDHYLVEIDDLMFDLLEAINEDQFLVVSKKFTEIRTLMTSWEHDYLTKVRKAVSVVK